MLFGGLLPCGFVAMLPVGCLQRSHPLAGFPVGSAVYGQWSEQRGFD